MVVRSFKNLIRQPYVVRAKYNVSKDIDFGWDFPPYDLNSKEGILHWADLPDPPHSARPQMTVRKKVEIWHQANIPTILADNKYT